jgi:hypothetical protein
MAGTGPVVNGGRPYGTENLIPLLGGSSGGMGDAAGTNGPHGGGAIQIVSGSSIVLSETAIINMGGAPGVNAGDRGGGGGSGGGILLEAPIVTVRGVLAANGASGSGGYLSGPQPGGSGDQPAICTNGTCGFGSAAGVEDGGEGPAGAGGGGGAGRIRINAGCGGTITIGPTAIISPSKSTGCYTDGQLQ